MLLALTVSPVLHPRYKLKYFETAKWPGDWIRAAETAVHDEYADWLSRHGEQEAASSTSEDEDGGIHGGKKKVRDWFLLHV